MARTHVGAVLAAVMVLSYVTSVAGAQEPELPLAAEEETPWSVELDASFYSKYVFRGAVVSNNWVMQPSAALSYRDLTATVWGNLELTNGTLFPGHGDSAGDFTEIDYILDYSWAHDDLNFSVGVIVYAFPNTSLSTTTELYGAVGIDTLLSPTLTVYQDIDEADGTYANLSIGHTVEDILELGENVSVSADLAAAVGWGSGNHNAFYYGPDQSGLTDVLLSLGLPIQIGDHVTVTPSLAWSALIDNNIRAAMSDDSNFIGGISLTAAF